MENRRSSPRLAVNQLAELRIENNLRPIPCTVEDISAGGMCVSLNRNLFPEVFSNVSFSILDNFGFDVGATVAWQESLEGRNTYGLRFERIDDSDRERISQYVGVGNGPSEEERNNWWRGL
jgi:c-di-GMP-binding flagellar brake protein YcgR